MVITLLKLVSESKKGPSQKKVDRFKDLLFMGDKNLT